LHRGENHVKTLVWYFKDREFNVAR